MAMVLRAKIHLNQAAPFKFLWKHFTTSPPYYSQSSHQLGDPAEEHICLETVTLGSSCTPNHGFGDVGFCRRQISIEDRHKRPRKLPCDFLEFIMKDWIGAKFRCLRVLVLHLGNKWRTFESFPALHRLFEITV